MDAFTLSAKLMLESGDFERNLGSAENSFRQFGNKMGGISGNSGKLAASNFIDQFASVLPAISGAAIIHKAGKAIYQFASNSLETYAKFDKSMSQVAATMGISMQEMTTIVGETDTAYGKFTGTLRDFARFMGGNTVFSASEAADALNYMALAGYDAQTSMDMLPNVLNLAAAGNIDLAYASDMVTDASSALGLTIKQTSQLVDKMAKASSKSNTSVAQLGEAILTVGGTAKNLSGGTTELATALGILADNGVKGSEGGTALRNVLLSLQAPTDKARMQLKNLGVSVYDARGNLRSLSSIFQDLNSGLSSLTGDKRAEVLSDIFNKNDLKSVEALLGTLAERWRELGEEIENANGAAQNMADIQQDNLEGDRKARDSAKESAKIAFAGFIEPTARAVVQQQTEAWKQTAEAFGAITDSNKDLRYKWGATLDAINNWIGVDKWLGLPTSDFTEADEKRRERVAQRQQEVAYQDQINNYLRNAALASESISEGLKQNAIATGDYSYIIQLLYESEGSEKIQEEINKIIEAAHDSPYDIDSEFTGDTDEIEDETKALDDLSTETHADYDVNSTYTWDKSDIEEAIKALADLATQISENNYDSTSTHIDNTTFNAEAAFDALAKLAGYTDGKEFLTSSEHENNVEVPIKQVKELLGNYFTWNEENGTIESKSGHNYAEMSSALATAAMILMGYKADYDDKVIAEPRSEFKDNSTGPIKEAEAAIESISKKQGVISRTESIHTHYENTVYGPETNEAENPGANPGSSDTLSNLRTMHQLAIGGGMGMEAVQIGGDGMNVFKKIHAQSMFGGSILRGSTLFGWDASGRPQFGGGEGPEAVVGVNSLDQMIQRSVNNAVGGILSRLDSLISGQGQQEYKIVLDTGALVGCIAPEMNSELSRIAQWNGGGRA